MSNAPVVFWFRQDLRLADNPALVEAARRGPVVPVFVWAPDEDGDWPPGAASRWWLHHSLADLSARLAERGLKLVVRAGSSLDELRAVANETGARTVCWSRRYEPAARQRDEQVARALRRDGVEVVTGNSALLFEPDRIATGDGSPYRVFTPFWRRCLTDAEVPAPLPKPDPTAAEAPVPSLDLGELRLLPEVDWAAGLRATWTPGEAGALARLDAFLGVALDGYAVDRDRPDLAATSRLSPHLHFGEIGPRQVWHAVRKAGTSDEDRDRFLSEAGWREFAHHLLWHFPDTVDQPLRPEFARFPWRDDPAGLRAWRRGRTGYPFVDAAMRQLWRTGWMHNRARMVVASFLVKDLLLPWQAGARWFWDTLVDADLASNTLGWQWTAGCGADAAPYFRVFNPVGQGEKHDPEGAFVARYLPELAALPALVIHQPWNADQAELRQAGVALGVTYPAPVVDHATARRRALTAYRDLREAGDGG